MLIYSCFESGQVSVSVISWSCGDPGSSCPHCHRACDSELDCLQPVVLPSCCSPIRIVCSSDKAEIKIDRQHGHKEATRGPSIARQSASPNSHRTWGLLQKAVCNMPQQEPCNHQTLSIQYHYVLSMMIWWVKAKISLTQPLMNDNWMIVNNYNYCY